MVTPQDIEWQLHGRLNRAQLQEFDNWLHAHLYGYYAYAILMVGLGVKW